MNEPIRFYWKQTCSKCVRAHDLLKCLGVELQEREFSQAPLTAEEIRQIAPSGSVLDVINPQREAYKELGFQEKPPTEGEALAAMMDNDNLIYRPIVVRGSRMVTGWDDDKLRALVED